ncbi:MAG: GspE/PulE family protein [Myxococcaceae bacterium]
MPRVPRASDFTFHYVTEVLAKAGLLSDASRKTAMARESIQRGRLLKEDASVVGRLRGGELSPIRLLASFKFPSAKNPAELLEEDKIAEVAAKASGLGYKKVDPLKLDGQLITRTVSRPFARKHLVLPIERTKTQLTVAVANPFDRELFESLRRFTGAEILPVLSSPADIQRAISEVYGFRQSIRAAETQVGGAGADVGNLEQFFNLTGLDALEASSEPIVAAVEYILHYAFEQRASDIHIEPQRDECTVRMRIDGVLHPVYQVPKVLHAAITNRLKIMSRLDITSRKPQDGRLRTAVGESEMELRISTVPTAFGHKVVVRILDPNVLLRDLSELGLLDDEKAQLEKWLLRPHGLVVVTGPTGSGKTTTLYSAMQALASPELNLVTIEDPIEMVQPGFNQVQADSKTGTGFGEALRHVLRQDPDVIMVGEIRDPDTAAQAVQAALTGHLVLTSLHTSDAVGAVARLHDLGVPHFLIAATLTGVLAQRLVRAVCPSCTVDVPLTADEVAELGVVHPEDFAGKLLARRGPGCPRCRYTGFYGRTGLFEVLSIERRLRALISEGASPDVLERTALQDGLRTLRDHAVLKVAGGVTSFEEAMRATSDAEAEW